MFLIRLLTKIFLNFCGINKKSKMQTTMKKNNLNPAWKESFDIDWHGEEIIQNQEDSGVDLQDYVMISE